MCTGTSTQSLLVCIVASELTIFLYNYYISISRALHTVLFYVILNTRKSNFAMRVDFIHTVRAHSTSLHSLVIMHAFTIISPGS